MNSTEMIYDTLPAVSELNKVQGFDPRKFLRKTVSELTRQEVLYLDLKFRKLWFRLKYPKGRIKLTALKITEQLAIFEAKVFFESGDTEAVSSFVAERYAKGKLGALYIENAQNAAVGQALSDAGFGLQFCDIGQGPDLELIDGGIAAPISKGTLESVATQVHVEVIPDEAVVVEETVEITLRVDYRFALTVRMRNLSK